MELFTATSCALDKANQTYQPDLVDLDDLQLAVVGGGIAEVILG